MKQSTCRHRRRIGFLPVSFWFYERLLDTFQVSMAGLGGAFVSAFLFMVAVQEWMSRRFVW
jgi:hypothetical protein